MNKITLADQLVGGTLASGTIAAAMPCFTPRRRARLNGSCAAAALLALPAAMSVGILLARPAQAQTVIANNKTATVILGNTTNYPDGSPFTIDGGFSVLAPTGDGVYGNTGTRWTLNNYGTVVGGTANGVGFGTGGSINNGLSGGSVGTIVGATDGVYITGSYGVIGNVGVIQGSANSGIELLAGGTIYNQSAFGYTGTITGAGDGVLISNVIASLTNQGTIIGATGSGVRNTAGGYVYNESSGVITGSIAGVGFAGAYGTLANAGNVSGATGAAFDTGGTVVNGGLINGTGYGVSISGGLGTVVNYGGTDGYGPGTINGDTGVLISSGNGFVINTDPTPSFAQATIAGSSYGVKLTGTDGTVVNYGLISANGEGGVGVSGTLGIVFNYSSIIGNGAGILMSGGGDVLNGPTGFISGATGVGIDGGGSIASSVVNYGQITGTQYGVSLSGGPNTGTLGFGEDGTLNAVFNSGTISETGGGGGNDAGIFLSGVGEVFNGVSFNNGDTLTIGNTLALINGATYGVLASGGSVGVGNAGIITGTAGSGIKIADAGFVENLGTVLGGQTGVTVNGDHSEVFNVYDTTASIIPLISGGSDGVLMTGQGVTMVNIGTVIGNDDNTLTPSGTGVSLANGGFIFNAPSASMFAVISGADDGVHVSGLDGYMVNTGYVVGTNGTGTGVAFDNGGYLSNSSIGTIQGGSIGVAIGVHQFGTQVPAGVIANAGSILGGEFGVSMAGYGAVNNTVGGYIRGDTNGIYIAGSGASVSNLGTITTATLITPLVVPLNRPFGEELPSTGVSFANGGAVYNGDGGYIYGTSNGVVISGGVQSSVTNTAGGYIKGGTIGVVLSGNNDQLYNSGAIAGYLHGVVLNDGGDVYNNGTIVGAGTGNFSDGVILTQGGYVGNGSAGVIAGNIYGVNAVDAGQLTVNNYGTIAALGSISGPNPVFGTAVYAAYGGTLTNGTLALITGSGYGVVSKGTMDVTNSGSIFASTAGILLSAGSVVNAGLIDAVYTGVLIQGTNASVSNLAGGEIYGGSGVVLQSGGAQLYNAGGINAGRTGVELFDGGLVYNSGTIQALDAISQGILLDQGGTVTNAAGGVIYGYNYGVKASGAPINVLNDGTIIGETFTSSEVSAAGVGVLSQAGGTLTNGTLGVIYGLDEGVLAYGTMGVTNHGGIYSARYGVSVDTGSVFNDGFISAGESGVYVNNGNVTNAAGGTIIGYRNGVFTNGSVADSVGNAGTIIGSGSYGTGIYLEAGGTVTNTGLIGGGEYGVAAEYGPATVINSGTIGQFYAYNSTYAAVYLYAGGTVVNMAGGTLYGADTGVIVSNAAGTIYNAGLIDGIGYDGVSLNHGGSVVNMAAGTILGAHIGVYTGYAGASVANYGVIAGADGDGVSLYQGGSVFNAGTITGGFAGVYIAGAGSQVMNEGQITGGVYGVLANGGSIINGSTAFIYGASVGISGVVNPVNVENLGGTIIGANGIGVSLASGGDVTNYEGGLIEGEDIGVQLASAGTVINAGTIVGVQSGSTSYTGVSLLDGGYVHNYSTGLIGGYGAGVYLGGGGTVALRNEGTVYGYRTGVSLGDGGTVMNSGSIGSPNIGVAGNGSVTQLFNSGIIDGADEIGVTLATGGNVTNTDTGYIYGEYTGVDLAQAGTVLNSGKISTEIDAGEVHTYNGVLLHQGGVVHNYGSGSIYGYTSGVYSAGGLVSVVNAGLISGYSYGVNLRNAGTAAVLVNDGTLSGIGGNSSGAFLQDGTVINQQGGVITGEFAVEMDGGTVLNAGVILGGYSGVTTDGSLVANYTGGTITGGVYGVGLFGGESATLLNSGTITGTGSFGVTLTNDGSVNNDAGGVISGGSFGLGAHGTVAVTNSGTIFGATGFGIGINYGTVVNTQGGTIIGGDVGVSSYQANVTNAGSIGGGEAGVDGYRISVDNLAAGRITGDIGVGIYGSLAAVTNAGTIIGTTLTGVNLANGGTVTNYAGGFIYGDKNGISAASFIGVDNSGTVASAAGTGVNMYEGGNVLNRAGGVIYGDVVAVYAKGTVGATITNAGLISGYYGIDLKQGGLVANLAGATIASTDDAVYISNAYGTVMNAGSITGGTGIRLTDGGAVYNMAGGSITGAGLGVIIQGTAGTVINMGDIRATAIDSDGVLLVAAGSIDNSGAIFGTEYGVKLSDVDATLVNRAGGQIFGGYAGITTNDDTIINAGSIGGGVVGAIVYGGVLNNFATGTIKGGETGLYAGYGAVITNAGQILDDSSAGARLGDNTTLTNQPGGTIAGVHGIDFDGTNSTVFNAGTIASTEGGGTAIAFLGTGVNYLTLSTGSVLDGIIDGGGTGSQIDLVGNGTLGNTIQNFGTAGALTVADGASWIGTGNWSIATVTNNGTFQGGMLNKPLNLTGDFIQASLATLKVVVTPTLSTQFLITGAAQLAGKLTYVFAPGYYSPHTYDFLTASDGTTGNFDTVTYSGYVPPQLTHTTNATPPGANLVLAGNGVVTPADDGVFNAQSQTMADSAQQANTSLLGKASQGAGAGSSAAQACAAEAGAAQNTAAGSATTASRMATAVASAFCGAGGWIEATGTEMNADSSGGADDYHADTGGFLAGIDKAVNNAGTRVGLAVGYDETWLHDGGGGKADVNTVRVGLYASQPIGRFTIAADIMYGHGDDTTHRVTGIGEANAKYGTNIYSGAVQGSTELFLGPVELVPAAGVRIAHIAAGSFAETGGGFVPAFAVSGNGTGYTSVEPFVNVGLSHSFLGANGMSITPSLGAGFIYEAGDRGKAVDVTADDFTNFAATHNNLDRATAVVSAGIAAGRNNWSLFAHYTAYVSGNWTSQTAEAGLQVKF